MNGLMVILRLIHIGAGVFWAGTMFFLVRFLLPILAASGPEGGRLMQRLIQARLSVAMGFAGGLTVLSGLIIYGIVSSGFKGAWIATGTGIILTIGSLSGIAAAIFGAMTGAAGQRLGAIMAEVQKKGGSPSPAQSAEMQMLPQHVVQTTRVTALLLLVAVIAMAIARYI